MADLQCRLQETVNTNRETLNNRAEDRRIKEEVTQSRQQQPGTAQAKLGSTDKQAGNTAQAQRQGSTSQAGNQQAKVSQQQALEAAGKKVGKAQMTELRKQLSARRDTDGLLEPIYIVQYGDDTETSYETLTGSVLTRPNQTLFVFRGDTLISAIEPMNTVPFDLQYLEYKSNTVPNAVAQIESFGGFVASDPVSGIPRRNQWLSFRVGGFLVADGRLYITYCRGVRVFEERRLYRAPISQVISPFLLWRKPDWNAGVYSVTPGYMTAEDTGPSYVYFDFATYQVNLTTGEVAGLAAPFLQYKIQSDSAKIESGYLSNMVGFDDSFWVEHTYSRTVTHRSPAEALKDTIPQEHPAGACPPDFWQSEQDYELPPVSTSGGVWPIYANSLLDYQVLYGPDAQPDDYINGISAMPPTQWQSVNTVESLKVISDTSGVGELASIDQGLLNCSGLRLAFGRYSGSFGTYSAGAVDDFDAAFLTENMSEQALALFDTTPTPPSSVTPISITGTPTTPDPDSVFFMATPEDPDVVDTLFIAYAGDPYFAGYLIAPEDS